MAAPPENPFALQLQSHVGDVTPSRFDFGDPVPPRSEGLYLPSNWLAEDAPRFNNPDGYPRQIRGVPLNYVHPAARPDLNPPLYAQANLYPIVDEVRSYGSALAALRSEFYAASGVPEPWWNVLDFLATSLVGRPLAEFSEFLGSEAAKFPPAVLAQALSLVELSASDVGRFISFSKGRPLYDFERSAANQPSGNG